MIGTNTMTRKNAPTRRLRLKSAASLIGMMCASSPNNARAGNPIPRSLPPPPLDPTAQRWAQGGGVSSPFLDPGLERWGRHHRAIRGRWWTKHAVVRPASWRKRLLDEASGVSGWTLHDLRRTARSLMSRAGVTERHAEECLGHVQGGVRAT